MTGVRDWLALPVLGRPYGTARVWTRGFALGVAGLTAVVALLGLYGSAYELTIGSKVAIYAVPNSGGWYDFGYFLGIVVFGVGARKTVTRVVYRDRGGPIIDATARQIQE